MKPKTKKSLIQNGIFAGAILLLFLTGAHTQVLAFVQRGMLQTGLMDPKLERPAETDNSSETAEAASNEEADFNLQLRDVSGKKVSLEEFRGKAILINIWATWCPPCIAEMPGINELYKDVKNDNVEFVMLSVDQNFEKAKEFQKENEYEFSIYELAGPMPSMYASRAIPTTYVIDAEGKLVLTHKGMGDFDTKEFRDFLQDIQ